MMTSTTEAGITIQQLVEQALALSSVTGCLVIGEELTGANLRWAGNSLTTNGQTHSRKLTVISIVDESGTAIDRCVSACGAIGTSANAGTSGAMIGPPVDSE